MISFPEAHNEAEIIELPVEPLLLHPPDNVCHTETEIIKNLETFEHIKDKTFVLLFPTDSVHLSIINPTCSAHVGCALCVD